MKNYKKVLASLAVTLILFAVISSLFVIEHEANHQCVGEGCPVCEIISVCQITVKTVADVSAVFALSAVLFKLACFSVSDNYSVPDDDTLISLKVKLLN